ncbi:MAG: GGDEF domain-containing protein [Lachnospiraceae bacterium]|nr:GGDEF domain-containing protein [Lachnospiraceae bacterium]
MKTDRYHNFKLFKLIQLILLVLFGIAFFSYLNLDPVLSNNVYSNRNLLTICVFLWGFMLYSVICLIADFSQLQKEIINAHKLNQQAYLDSLTGLPNRNGCDVMFGKYTLRRDIGNMGCALIALTRIDEINYSHGRSAGDKYIRDFALIFEGAASGYGFVGRNSGNEFLLVIENCPESRMQEFIEKLKTAVDNYNKENPDPLMDVKLGYVLNEQEKLRDFPSLISTLYSRERQG